MPDKRYWTGTKNKTIRYYYYIQKGLLLLNEMRYLILGIFTIYFTLKFDNILLIPLMFICCLPILLTLGWLAVHHMDKVIEYLNIEFATHFSRHNIDLQERQLQMLGEILDELKRNSNINSKIS